MEIERYFSKLQEITDLSSYILNDLETTEHANLITKKVTEIFEVDACVIRILKGDELHLLGAYGVPHEKLVPVLYKYEGLAAKLFNTRKPQSIYDVSAEPVTKSQINKRKNELKFLSYAGAPLIADKTEIGVLGIYRIIEKRDFSPAELHVLQLVSNQVALRLQNSKLFVDLLKQNATLEEEIDKRRKTETELIKAKDLAEHSERIKSEFLAQVSHEIRSPLSGMMGFISLIKDSLEDNSVSRNDLMEYFNSINLSATRLVRTIDLLLNVSEVQNKAFKPIYENVKLKSVLNDLIREYQALAKTKNLDLICDCDKPDTSIYVDRYSFVQILSNLVDNAIKYTREGYIKVSHQPLGKNGHEIIVEDSGIGISKEYQKHIFKAFSQEETGYTRKFDGSGLGLSLVKSYCEINRIDIKIESEKNKGTRFILTFQKWN